MASPILALWSYIGLLRTEKLKIANWDYFSEFLFSLTHLRAEMGLSEGNVAESAKECY